MRFWQTTRFKLNLDKPLIMGIINSTPDSFSDGGSYFNKSNINLALKQAEKLLKDGADILDIGGESTRPEAIKISLEEELKRIIPLIKELVKLNIPISVDTYKAEVMQQVLDLGVDIINDIYALRQKNARQIIINHSNCGICLMDNNPQLNNKNFLNEIYNFLNNKSQDLINSGVNSNRIVLDYGIGFGKTTDQNFNLLANQNKFLKLNLPLLVGWSRKRSLGEITNLDVKNRILPSVVAVILAVERGAKIVRVHDIMETKTALKVWQAMKKEEIKNDS